jgi:hypothetical protein
MSPVLGIGVLVAGLSANCSSSFFAYFDMSITFHHLFS